MIDIITPLVKGATKETTDKRKQIFDEPAHIAMDNFFSGDEVLRLLGERGWKATMTCRRDRLTAKKCTKSIFQLHQGSPCQRPIKSCKI